MPPSLPLHHHTRSCATIVASLMSSPHSMPLSLLSASLIVEERHELVEIAIVIAFSQSPPPMLASCHYHRYHSLPFPCHHCLLPVTTTLHHHFHLLSGHASPLPQSTTAMANGCSIYGGIRYGTGEVCCGSFGGSPRNHPSVYSHGIMDS